MLRGVAATADRQPAITSHTQETPCLEETGTQAKVSVCAQCTACLLTQCLVSIHFLRVTFISVDSEQDCVLSQNNAAAWHARQPCLGFFVFGSTWCVCLWACEGGSFKCPHHHISQVLSHSDVIAHASLPYTKHSYSPANRHTHTHTCVLHAPNVSVVLF